MRAVLLTVFLAVSLCGWSQLSDCSDCSRMLIDNDDLYGLDQAELRLLKNEIYARKGYVFSSKDLKDHFSRFSWYKPIGDNSKVKLTSTETKNVDKIDKQIKLLESGEVEFVEDCGCGDEEEMEGLTDCSECSDRVLSSDELYGLSNYVLRLLKNEIYARKGYTFSSKDLQTYFSQFSWYRPLGNNSKIKLSSIETQNVNIIDKQMKSQEDEEALTITVYGQKQLKDCSECSSRLIEKEELYELGISELRLLKNEIYARKGYDFSSKDLRYYFSRFSWYNPIGDNSKVKLTSTETKNVSIINNRIKILEKQYN